MVSEIERASAAAQGRIATTPRAISVGQARDGRLLIELSNGVGLLVDPQRLQGLEGSTPEDLNRVEISPSGFGLHFPTLDADIYVPGLLEGRTGSLAYMAAAAMGARGGMARTAAKAQASRENGRKGGRPRKVAGADAG